MVLSEEWFTLGWSITDGFTSGLPIETQDSLMLNGEGVILSAIKRRSTSSQCCHWPL